MMDPMDEGVIILNREPGPVEGTTTVTVDYLNLRQATIVVDNGVVNQPRERNAIRLMLDARINDLEALREANI